MQGKSYNPLPPSNSFTPQFFAATPKVWLLLAMTAIFLCAFAASSSAQILIPGKLIQVAAGTNEVWGINAAQDIFRYDFDGNSFIRVPGALAQIAVGHNSDVWGLNSQGQSFQAARQHVICRGSRNSCANCSRWTRSVGHQCQRASLRVQLRYPII